LCHAQGDFFVSDVFNAAEQHHDQEPCRDRLARHDGDEHIRLWWMLTWYTGFRQETFRTLTWRQVDLETGTVTFRRGKHT
jgi:integrase